MWCDVQDETLAMRPLKPLRWLLKVIQQVYDAKFVADAVDNRYGHPHDALPEASTARLCSCKSRAVLDF